jgi:hypothetical protein
VEYAYQCGANEIYKIIGPLDETHLKVEKHRGDNYERHPDENGYTMSISTEPIPNLASMKITDSESPLYSFPMLY